MSCREASLRHGALKVAGAGRDHAHVGMLHVARTGGAKLLVLQKAQQLGLCGKRRRIDFVA
jgi:hypothetical protein